MGSTSGWEHFPHVADIGVHGWAPTKAAAFEQAALALVAIVSDPDKVRSRQEVEISCRAPDDELLLVDWLNAIVFEMATRTMLFGQFRVEIVGNELRGNVRGEQVEVARHQPAAEVKGATLSELEVFQDTGNTWHARCIVDV